MESRFWNHGFGITATFAERIGIGMKKLFVGLLMGLLVFTTACSASDRVSQVDDENIIEGVELSVKEDSLAKSSGTFVLANLGQDAISYNTKEYHMEENTDGGWMEFIGTASSAWDKETTTTLDAGASVELPVNWKSIVGPLATGNQYRMVVAVEDGFAVAEFVID